MAHNEQGLAGTVLVIIIAWALAAVFMLVVTLVAAQDIRSTVGQLPDPEDGSILNEVVDIEGNLGPVGLATQTERTSSDILTAAEPLDGQLDQVLAATDSIDASANSILGSASEINSTASSIDASVTEINSSVTDIQQRLASTNSTVTDSIKPGVAAINNRADTIIALVRSIESDTTAIQDQTKLGSDGDFGIRGHAQSIDCRLNGGLTGGADCPGGPLPLPGELPSGLLDLPGLSNVLGGAS